MCKKLSMTRQCTITSPEIQPHPELHPKQHGHWGEEDDSPPLLCCHESPPAVGTPTSEGGEPVGTSPEKSHRADQKVGIPLL